MNCNLLTYEINSRPIVHASVLSKTMERVLNNQMLGYLEATISSVIENSVFAVVDLLETFLRMPRIYGAKPSKNAGNHLPSVDKSFARAWHDSRLNKIPSYGIPVSFCTWLADFLRGTLIRVVVGSYSSALHRIDAGIPQGSLFSVYYHSLSTTNAYCRWSLCQLTLGEIVVKRASILYKNIK